VVQSCSVPDSAKNLTLFALAKLLPGLDIILLVIGRGFILPYLPDWLNFGRN
jgi:hypothetical protein